MQLASTSGVVEVRGAADPALEFKPSSVGGMLNAQQVLDLPLPSRDALRFLIRRRGHAGGALNITLDGVNIQDQRVNPVISSRPNFSPASS